MKAKAGERRIVTPEWIYETYHVNGRWLERRIEDGDLRPLKCGRLNRFYEDEVVAYVERGRAAS